MKTQPTHVIKRDGSAVTFEKGKIVNAVRMAFIDTGEGNEYLALELANTVVNEVQRLHLKTAPHIETIQDVVEELLIRHNFRATAKSYILYRNNRMVLREAYTKK